MNMEMLFLMVIFPEHIAGSPDEHIKIETRSSMIKETHP